MDNFEMKEEMYTINHITLFTGLSDRTIRNYISLGFLQGEKINGMWHFSPEQVESFLRNPAVRPSIVAKNNALIYDFLLDSKKQEPQCCIVLDMPDEDRKKIAEYFCYSISNGNYRNIYFSFDSVDGTPRVILKGYTKDVLELVNNWENKA